MKTKEHSRRWIHFKKISFIDHLYQLRSAFIPFHTIGFCLILIGISSVVFLLGYIFLSDKTGACYQLLFAIVTGVAASSVVTISVELMNNRRNSRKRSYELQEYLQAISSYKREIIPSITTYRNLWEEDTRDLSTEEAATCVSSYDLAWTRACLYIQNVRNEDETSDPSSDEAKEQFVSQERLREKVFTIRALVDRIPKLLKVLRETFKNHLESLSEREMTCISSILNSVDLMEKTLQTGIMIAEIAFDGTEEPAISDPDFGDSSPAQSPMQRAIAIWEKTSMDTDKYQELTQKYFDKFLENPALLYHENDPVTVPLLADCILDIKQDLDTLCEIIYREPKYWILLRQYESVSEK